MMELDEDGKARLVYAYSLCMYVSEPTKAKEARISDTKSTKDEHFAFRTFVALVAQFAFQRWPYFTISRRTVSRFSFFVCSNLGICVLRVSFFRLKLHV